MKIESKDFRVRAGKPVNLKKRPTKIGPFYKSKKQCKEMLRDRIEQVLRTLTYREREIIKLRYGLGDGYSYTLEEVGHIFKVTRERIRQIEAKAVRKLQQPSRSAELIGFLD